MELYQTVANLTESAESGKSYKNKLYSTKNKKNIRSLHLLCVNSVKKKIIIDELLLKVGVSGITWLKRVILYEFLWGRRKNIMKLKSNAVVDEIIKHHQAILKHFHHIEKEKPQGEKEVPRYLRVNLEKVTETKYKEILEENNFEYNSCPATYKDFLRKVELLENNECMSDFHIPHLLVFSHNAKVDKFPKEIFIRQDKASCLVVPLLAPLPGSSILDMCAAPGFKTQHAVSYISKVGRIYSIDINKERFLTLNQTIKQFGMEHCCIAMNKDALKVNEDTCPNVEYIILDAPCSGTGMSNTLIKHVASEDRLRKLHNLQVMLLKHALKTFLCVRRIVYSTCSVTEEENEQVVSECLETAQEEGFSLVPLASAYKGTFKSGRGDYPCSPFVLTTSTDSDLTNGFFVALFERSVPPKLPNWSDCVNENSVSIENVNLLGEDKHPNLRVHMNENTVLEEKENLSEEDTDAETINEYSVNKANFKKNKKSNKREKKLTKISNEGITAVPYLENEMGDNIKPAHKTVKAKRDNFSTMSTDISLEQITNKKINSLKKKLKKKTMNKKIMKVLKKR